MGTTRSFTTAGVRGSAAAASVPHCDASSVSQSSPLPTCGTTAPATTAGSCGSTPYFTKLPRVPCSRKRGSGTAASIVAPSSARTLRPSRSNSRVMSNASSMAPASRSLRTLAVSVRGRPNSASAWSTRCGPRSISKPFSSPSASFQVFSRTSGRNRSNRDRSTTGRPTSPSRSSLCRVKKSPSNRRLWNGITSRLVSAASASSCRAPSSVGANGLSITTCLSARNAAVANGTCVLFGVAITTSSTSLASRLSRLR